MTRRDLDQNLKIGNPGQSPERGHPDQRTERGYPDRRKKFWHQTHGSQGRGPRREGRCPNPGIEDQDPSLRKEAPSPSQKIGPGRIAVGVIVKKRWIWTKKSGR